MSCTLFSSGCSWRHHSTGTITHSEGGTRRRWPGVTTPRLLPHGRRGWGVYSVREGDRVVVKAWEGGIAWHTHTRFWWRAEKRGLGPSINPWRGTLQVFSSQQSNCRLQSLCCCLATYQFFSTPHHPSPGIPGSAAAPSWRPKRAVYIKLRVHSFRPAPRLLLESLS